MPFPLTRNAPYTEVTNEAENLEQSPPAATWLPYSLRGSFFGLFALYDCALIVAVALLYWKSKRDFGLTDDDGTSLLVFASRFVPTLLSVAYVLIATIIADDVKRTEPYAQLASPFGALADATLLEIPGPWWTCIGRSFPSRRKGRDMRWALLSSTSLYILGILVLSPFSSSLLASKEVLIPESVPFNRINLATSNAPLPLQAKQSSYFRTIAHTLQNVSTSAWITDDFFVLPFWPSSTGAAPLGPILSTRAEYWQGQTTVLTTELTCEPMTLARKAWNIEQISTTEIINASFVLSSETGCSYGVFLPAVGSDTTASEMGDFATNGGASWSTPATLALGPGAASPVAYTYSGDLVNSSSCSGEIYFMTTNPVNYNLSNLLSTVNRDFSAIGQICSHQYYAADVSVTAELSQDSGIVYFDQADFRNRREKIGSQYLNTEAFQGLFMSQNWTYHVKTITTSPPIIGGPIAVLAASYNFSMDAMIKDPNITAKASRLKQRFFGEVVQDAISSLPLSDQTTVVGTISTVRRRITVVSVAALTIGITLFLQLLLLCGTFYASRLSRRPLALFRDPAPALAIASMFAISKEARRRFSYLARAPEKQAAYLVGCNRYKLHQNVLHLVEDHTASSEAELDYDISHQATGWRPAFLSWPLITVLIVILVATLAAASALYAYSRGSTLYQTFFVYEATVTVGSDSLGNIGPTPILTTFLAVMIGLWWGSLENNMRRIQPFITMSKGPSPMSKGAALSYQSSYSLFAALRSSSNKHWLLAALSFASFLAQILTISMSALWQRDYGAVESPSQVSRQLELRRIPFLTSSEIASSVHHQPYQGAVLQGLYSNLQTNWLYGAAIQLSLNGTQLAWSSDDWSFVPVDLTSVQNSSMQNFGSSPTQSGFSATSNIGTNVSVWTQAIRARLQCSPYVGLDDKYWVRKQDLTNSSVWNITGNPRSLKTGYELGCGRGPSVIETGDTMPAFNIFPNKSLSDPCATVQYTSFFANPSRLICCVNDTAPTPGPASVGYWSANLPKDVVDLWSFPKWPYNFTVKWIHGSQMQEYFQINDTFTPHLIWSERPNMTALNCEPIIETANASIMVDHTTGRVLSYNISDKPQPDPHAWSDPFRTWTNSKTSANQPLLVNVTTSYGVIFLDALLSAADLNNVGGPDEVIGYESTSENLQDLTFNIRSPGLNADYMTYSMLSMANNDHQALLDPDTLQTLAQRTLSTFFQHYASSNVTFADGGRTYQKINATLPADIGKEGSYASRRRQTTTLSSTTSTTNNNIANLQISRSVVVLQTSKTAVWISIIILCWLIIIAVIFAICAPRQIKSLHRRIETVGDIAALVAGSTELLKIVEQRRYEDVVADNSLKTRLGYFTPPDEGGKSRYGIELCSGAGGGATTRDNDDIPTHPTPGSHQQQDESEWETPALHTANPPPAGSSVYTSPTSPNRQSSYSRSISAISSRLPSHRSHRSRTLDNDNDNYDGDDGDIALIPLDRAQQEHGRSRAHHRRSYDALPEHDDDNENYRWDFGENMHASAEELAALEHMTQTRPNYH